MHTVAVESEGLDPLPDQSPGETEAPGAGCEPELTGQGQSWTLGLKSSVFPELLVSGEMGTEFWAPINSLFSIQEEVALGLVWPPPL